MKNKERSDKISFIFRKRLIIAQKIFMKSIIQYLFYLIFLTLTSQCLAQGIDTDRPDQRDGIYTLPQHIFQIENGITLTDEDFVNNFMLRYGLLNGTELRLTVDAGKVGKYAGLMPLGISVKQKVIEQNKALPGITLVAYLNFGKLASSEFQTDNMPYELKIAFENVLTDKLNLGYNIGTTTGFEELTLSVGLGYTPAENASMYLEYFSSFNDINAQHNIDIGILLNVKPYLQVDIACGRAIFSENSRFFSTFGIAYVFLK